jgi:hypothetical protein
MLRLRSAIMPTLLTVAVLCTCNSQAIGQTCRYHGQVYIKNTSGTAVSVVLRDVRGREHAKTLTPGHDTVLRGLCVSTSLFPPSHQALHGQMRDASGAVLRNVTVRLPLTTAFTAAAIVYDCGQEHPCFRTVSLNDFVNASEADVQATESPEAAECCGNELASEGGEQTSESAERQYQLVIEGDSRKVVEVSNDHVQSPDDEDTSPTSDEAATDASSVEVSERAAQIVTISAECTTRGTDLDGSRNSCNSAWTTFTLPNGHAFLEQTIAKHCNSCNGSSNRIDHEWADFVTIIPGTSFRAPRTLRVKVHARSPGCRGCRGWTKATVTAEYMKYQ